MAYKQGNVYFTLFTFRENGKTVNRQLYSLPVQDCFGNTYVLTGKDLPNYFNVDTGSNMATGKGENFAELLFAPVNDPSAFPQSGEKIPWPCGRDVVSFAIGLFAILMLRFFETVLGL